MEKHRIFLLSFINQQCMYTDDFQIEKTDNFEFITHFY